MENAALRGVFVDALSEQLKDGLAARVKPADFDALVSLAIRLPFSLLSQFQCRHLSVTSQLSLPGPLFPYISSLGPCHR